jgi:Flp pilus assembly protein TadG
MVHKAQAQKRQRKGSVATETALVLPVFFLLLFGIFEYGRYFMMRNLLANAAREGARYAIVSTRTQTTANVQGVVRNFLGTQQSQLQNLNVQVYSADATGNPISGLSWSNTPFGSGVGVQIDGDYAPVLPVFLLMPSTAHLRAIAVMNCEAN